MSVRISCRTSFAGFFEVILGVLVTLLFLSGDFSVSGIEIKYLILMITILLVFVGFSLGVNLRLPKLSLMFSLYWFLLVLLLFSAMWSLNSEQAVNEFKGVFTVLLFSIISLIIFSSFSRSINASLATFLFVALTYSAIAVWTSIQSGSRGTIILGGPNVASRVIFFGLLAALYFNASDRRNWLILVMPLLLAGIVALGSRGGVIGAMITLGVLLLVKLMRSRAWIPKFEFKSIAIGILALLVFVYYLFPLVSNVFESRIIELTLNRVYMAGRDSLYARAWELIEQRPIVGYGLGGYYGSTLSSYPHNLMLQVWLDGGIVLLALFFMLLAVTFRLVFLRKSTLSIVASGVLYMFIVHQVSGGYYDLRYVYYFLGILSVLIAKNRGLNRPRQSPRVS